MMEGLPVGEREQKLAYLLNNHKRMSNESIGEFIQQNRLSENASMGGGFDDLVNSFKSQKAAGGNNLMNSLDEMLQAHQSRDPSFNEMWARVQMENYNNESLKLLMQRQSKNSDVSMN